MIPTWSDFLAAQQHFEDLRREAEVDRLLRAGRAKPKHRWPSGSAVLAWLDQYLGSWRSPALAPVPISSQTPDCCTADCQHKPV